VVFINKQVCYVLFIECIITYDIKDLLYILGMRCSNVGCSMSGLTISVTTHIISLFNRYLDTISTSSSSSNKLNLSLKTRGILIYSSIINLNLDSRARLFTNELRQVLPLVCYGKKV
jgi:hypothetical protein